MRLGAAIDAQNPAHFSPQQCVFRAERLAEELVKKGFIKPTFELLKEKFKVYADASDTAYEARIPAKACGRDLRPDELKQLKYFIVTKDYFFAIADRLMPELIEEARRLLAEQSSAEGSEASLEFYLVNCFSEDDDLYDPEPDLLKLLEQQKTRDHEAGEIHAALINSKKAENNFIVRLRAGLKNSGGANGRRSVPVRPPPVD